MSEPSEQDIDREFYKMTGLVKNADFEAARGGGAAVQLRCIS